jgi:type 2 lantibiotic biosynthesis protein LanM
MRIAGTRPASEWWAPGLAPSERRQPRAAPSWASFTDRALVRAVRAGNPESDWAASFARILAPFAEEAAERMVRASAAASHSARIDVAHVRAVFLRSLAGRLVGLAARVLVLELNRTDELAGESAEQRFADFAGRMTGLSQLKDLLSRYPVLARLLAQTCEHAAEATVETLDRFAADRDTIVATILHHADPGALIAVEAGAGDRHQRGRSVAILSFASGARVVYKPRPLEAHARFNDVVGWLNGRMPDHHLRTLTVVERPGYGWVEFADAGPCDDRKGLERFYRRQGVLLALLYALDAADVHYENLIACGDHPVLVDVETLFHPFLSPPGTAGADPARAALEASVQRVALLPQPMFGDNGALDISGMGADKNSVLPILVVDWDGAGTDRMRLVRRPGVFRGADNRPRLDGVDADPVLFSDALLDGFRTGYGTIAAHRTDLAAKLQGFADVEIRVVVRATRGYVTLLDESTHPDVLRDAQDRDRLFDELSSASAHDPARSRLTDHEIAELWQGDVPMFTARPGHRHLWTGTGEQVDDLLDRTPLDSALDKLRAMSDIDRYDQEWVIRATLATREPHTGHDTGVPARRSFATTVAEPHRVLAAARGIADHVIARGFDDGHRVNWLGLELLDERHWTIMPLGAGLGNGYTGTALFLAQLAVLTGDTRYSAAARRALRPLPRLVGYLSSAPDLPAAVGCGGFAGFGGIAYALAQISDLLGDADIRDLVDPTVALAAIALDDSGADDGPGAEPDLGVVGGVAGCLAAMLSVAHVTRSEGAFETAVRAADRLAAVPVDPAAPPGFAHGAAGIGWALLRAAGALRVQRYRTRGAAWLHAAATDLDHAGGHAWCEGAPGVALALLAAGGNAAASPSVERTVVERAVAAVTGTGPLPNHSLCHGELGRLELLDAASRTGYTTPDVYARRASMLLAAIERSGARCGTPGDAASPGLLSGLAGIGHGLLRHGFPHDVPSAVLLRPRARHESDDGGISP